MITFLFWLLKVFYRYRGYNLEVLKSQGPVLLLPNHTSWWDWLLVGACLDSDWKFVTSAEGADVSWFHKKVMVNRRTFPVDINSPYAVKHMAEYLQKGGRLVLFPEGRLSRTGSLMKLFDGTGFLLHKTNAKVITAYVRGAYRLPWSPNPNRKEWFPRLSIHFSQVLKAPPHLHETMSESRAHITDWVYHQMVKQQFETEMQFGAATLPEAILDAARQAPGKVAMQDVSMQRVTYRKLVIGARLLAGRWRELLEPKTERIGVLLPNVNACPVTLLSLWLEGRIPALLNYSGGTASMLACAQLAGLKQIITAKAFVEQAKLHLEPMTEAGIRFLYLEDIRPAISRFQKLGAWVASFFPQNPSVKTVPADTAVVLFTSGSEGAPKGVELTHQNLLANIRQMCSVVDLLETDRFFNALPLFHSFGLSVALLLPLVRQVFVFLYVSPLHYRVIPSAIYNLNCTIFFGTNTFLNGYARKAHPYDFRSLRYLFAGAEKLQEVTANVWARKFGVRIIEGYGATECSPCLSANTPILPKERSVGQFLPGVEYRLEKVEGIEQSHGETATSHHWHNAQPEVGRLFVRGPNIMKGYLNPEANANFKKLGGWYDTGDIVRVEPDGFIFVLGRLKRFAKISGEMVSLTAVEDALASSFPQFGLKFAVAVVARPDENKGEKLIAVTNEPRLKLEDIREVIKARGLNNLSAPREIKMIHELPRLGTGKVNHRELERMV